MSEAEANGKGGALLLVGAAIVATVGIGAWVVFGSGDSSDETPSFTQLPVTTQSADGTPVESTGPGGAVIGVIDGQHPEIGQPAPDFALVSARDSSVVIHLSDFRGTPVVVNWYATWCAPCRAEIPDFKAAQDALGDDVVFLGVNLQESADKAVGLLDEFEATYPVVLDTDAAVFEHYRGLGMPTTFFIDADGIVVERGTGRVTEDALVKALGNLGLDYQPRGSD